MRDRVRVSRKAGARALGLSLFLALSACSGSGATGGGEGGAISAGTWTWDGSSGPWRDADGMQYSAMTLVLAEGNAPTFVLRRDYGGATPGRECFGTERRGYWDVDFPRGEMLLTVTAEREVCEPEEPFEELYRQETVQISGATKSRFSACWADCGRSSNRLVFRNSL